ncbi:unnamed protein product [Spirodela intermedia]|uniref:Uncharacterized protein n=1 Tax=Spirodela intermedia TaxID=51605 RepID=A0A7I8IUS2_SPIIN|nr:unnamed protein product [Spirodela intermedia]CAA6661301.1 unnamed protein product [Spirodela intermedia]
MKKIINVSFELMLHPRVFYDSRLRRLWV